MFVKIVSYSLNVFMAGIISTHNGDVDFVICFWLFEHRLYLEFVK